MMGFVLRNRMQLEMYGCTELNCVSSLEFAMDGTSRRGKAAE